MQNLTFPVLYLTLSCAIVHSFNALFDVYFRSVCKSYTNNSSRPSHACIELPSSTRSRPAEMDRDNISRPISHRPKKSKVHSKTRSKLRTTASATTSRAAHTTPTDRPTEIQKLRTNLSSADIQVQPSNRSITRQATASPNNSQHPHSNDDDPNLEPDLKDVLSELDAVEQRVSGILASTQKEANDAIVFALNSVMQGFADAVDSSRVHLPAIQRTRNFTRTAETHLHSLADLRGT